MARGHGGDTRIRTDLQNPSAVGSSPTRPTTAVREHLAQAEAPADRLAYAEALWAHARLLLLTGQDGAGAERAAEGSEQAARSGLKPSHRMSRSGQVLTSALNWFHQAEAAKQVRSSLLDAPADGTEA